MNSLLFYGFLISFALSSFLLILGIPILRKMKAGQNIREDGPKTHLKKQGTPTMGGIIILIGFSIPFIILSKIYLDLNFNQIMMFLFPIYIYLIIGFIDDLLIIINKNNKGITPFHKIIMQILGVLLYYILFLKDYNTIVDLYYIEVDFKKMYFLFVLLIFLSSTNAVNLTDGLDGLASGLLIISLIGVILISLLKERLDIVLFSVCTIASLMAFLIFNHNPALIFMGNAGSLMFGAMLGNLMILIEEEMLLLIIGIVFLIETLSVIIQVTYFKITKGKRVFLMAPIHHHFEKQGMNELTVDLLLWLIGLISIIVLFMVVIR